MKFIIIDAYYPAFMTGFYQRFPETLNLSYVKTKGKLLNQLFGTADFYSKNLKSFGHQAEEIVINDKVLQTKWAKENGQPRLLDWADGIHVPFTNVGYYSHWQDEILERQILDFKPDVLYCQNLYSPGPKFLQQIKKKTGTKVVGQVAFPLDFNREFLAPYDLILSSFPHFVSRFRKLGIKSEYFRIGFEATILPKLTKTRKQYAATFVGSFSRRHNNEAVLAAATDVWGYGAVPNVNKYHGEAWGIDMYNILHNSKITLNRHIETAGNHANNMRMYEATGAGTMLITDFKSDLKNIFIPGQEVETYRTKNELEEKVRYYLSHDLERRKIAETGQRRTLKEHTYKKRMAELIQILKRNI